jgi:hypothetical protein
MSTQQGVYLSDLHFEHKLWDKSSDFYKDEIKVYENRLEELVNRYTDKEMLSQIEHFQNQFVRQKEILDEIKHEVNKHEHALSDFAEERPIAVDHVKFRDHGKLREKVQDFEKIYSELKQDFQKFSAKWM